MGIPTVRDILRQTETLDGNPGQHSDLHSNVCKVGVGCGQNLLWMQLYV